jgi:hypothetical protein
VRAALGEAPGAGVVVVRLVVWTGVRFGVAVVAFIVGVPTSAAGVNGAGRVTSGVTGGAGTMAGECSVESAPLSAAGGAIGMS